MDTNKKGDLISREALIKEIGRTDEWYKGHSICNIIDNAPPVDAYEQGYTDGWKERFGEPDGRPKGDWVITKLQHGEDVTCPFCTARPRRSEYGYYLHDNYCPECGADLRKDKSSGGI